MSALYTHFGLDAQTIDFIGHALALHRCVCVSARVCVDVRACVRVCEGGRVAVSGTGSGPAAEWRRGMGGAGSVRTPHTRARAHTTHTHTHTHRNQGRRVPGPARAAHRGAHQALPRQPAALRRADQPLHLPALRPGRAATGARARARVCVCVCVCVCVWWGCVCVWGGVRGRGWLQHNTATGRRRRCAGGPPSPAATATPHLTLAPGNRTNGRTRTHRRLRA
jgi:hypothetical protein